MGATQRFLVASLAVLSVAGCSSSQDAADAPHSATRSATTTPALTALSLGTEGQAQTATVTVYGVDFPVAAPDSAARIQPEGKEFAVADVKVCPKSVNGPSPSDFRLIAQDSTTYTFWNVQIGAKDPNLTQQLFDSAPDLCTRGFLTFPIDPTAQLAQIAYVDGSGKPIIWDLTSKTTSKSSTAARPEATEVVEGPATPAVYPIECLRGEPGPALFSDGSTGVAQFCIDLAAYNRSNPIEAGTRRIGPEIPCTADEQGRTIRAYGNTHLCGAFNNPTEPYWWFIPPTSN